MMCTVILRECRLVVPDVRGADDFFGKERKGKERVQVLTKDSRIDVRLSSALLLRMSNAGSCPC